MNKKELIDLFVRKAGHEYALAEHSVSKSVKTEHYAKAEAFAEAIEILKEKLKDE